MDQMGTEKPLHLSNAAMIEARLRVQSHHIHLAPTFVVTSENSEEYNCVAWAAGDTTKNWWPIGDWWPNDNRSTSIVNFVTVFRDEGYEICGDGSSEAGFEKVVLFTRDGRPTHMARQLSTGRWTNKSGVLFDIALNNPSELEGGKIGRIELFMKRQIVINL